MQSDSNPSITMRHLIDGYQVSQAIHVAARLGIADLLADGGRSADRLATETGTHAPTLYRLLRALASIEVLREGNDGVFELTPLGQALRSDVEGSIADWAAFVGSPGYWQAWSGLLHSVRTGENAFQHIHGADVWSYRTNRPEESALFDRAMTALSRRSSAALIAAYDFGRFRTVVDVGGGTGALLAAILGAHPGLKGILFDQPHVVAAAGAFMERAGVADRCRIVGGSFFEGVPEAADAYVLRAVIHDWEDVDAVRILTAVRKAMAADGRVLMLERIVAPPNEGRDAKFSDLNMLVAPGGRERTREELEALLGPAGLQAAGVIDAGGFAIVEALAR
ncbi:methyltransferase [Variovorax sp. J22P240]|uniref:methyltransferase n=1 Tax=Variovorax sp. J22P240 TaxID=3053514 RepID=UPI0025762404|nr:methyltransferase [Variovorax sp. J22P240]MDM0002699.1 methyltransferase [Variovorax sp. J22P240]